MYSVLDYQLLSAADNNILSRRAKDLINNGYEPYGEPGFNSACGFFQAFIKYEKGSKK